MGKPIPIPGPLVQGELIKRYKRFLLDVKLEDGTVVTGHCPNSGSLDGCKGEGMPVLLTDHGADSGRKLQYGWQAVKVGRTWVGVNTMFANRLVEELLTTGQLKGLDDFAECKREVKYGQDNSRIDFLLTAEDGGKTYVEVKNTTLRIEDEAQFPDAVTTRGQKHLRELMWAIDQGHKSVLLFLVQRNDCKSFAPAAGYDPVYAELLSEAIDHGVQVRALQCKVLPKGISFEKELTVNKASAHPPQKLPKV